MFGNQKYTIVWGIFPILLSKKAKEKIMHSIISSLQLYLYFYSISSIEEKYEISPDILGQGSFGTVYKATNIATGQSFAMKKIEKQTVSKIALYFKYMLRFITTVY